MSTLSHSVQESTAIDIGHLGPARPRSQDRTLARPAYERLADARGRGRGRAFLHIALVIVVGLPVGAVAGFGALLVLLTAGSLISVAAVFLSFVFVALLAVGAAG